MKIAAIILDFDGVVVDSEWIANDVLAQILTRIGPVISVEEALDRYSGHRWSDCHRLIERDLGRQIDLDWLRSEVGAAVAARQQEVGPVAGITPFLSSQAHRELAIASSSEQEWLQRTLTRLELSHFFGSNVVSAAGLSRGKPHPDVYLHVATLLEVEPRECVVIEDHPVGAAAGAAAGMTVIGLLAASHIRPGHAERLQSAGAGHLAASYREATMILEALEAG